MEAVCTLQFLYGVVGEMSLLTHQTFEHVFILLRLYLSSHCELKLTHNI